MGWVELFGLVSGLVLVVLEILHSRWMWPFEIASCLAFLAIYLPMRLWGNSLIQVYYIVMAVVGIIAWAKDRAAAGDEDVIVLNRITPAVLLISAAVLAVGTPLCVWIMKMSGDSRPVLDALVTILSILATWWLTKSYIEQWYLWALADALNVLLFVLQRLDGVNASVGPLLMNIAFLASSAAGYVYWKKKGRKTYIS